MIPDLKVRHRLLLMPLLATAALFVVFVVAEISGARNQRQLRSLSTRLIPALEASRALETTLSSIQRALQDAVAGEDETILQETQLLRDQFLTLMSEARQLDDSRTDELGALQDRFLHYYDLAAETTLHLIYGGRTDTDLVITLETMTQSYTRLDASLKAHTQAAREAVSKAFAATVRNDARARLINGVHILTSVILLCLVSFYLARSLTRPLSDLVAVLRLSEGDTSVRAEVQGGGEVSELASAFNEMMDKIDAGRSAIEAHSWLMTGLTGLADALGSPTDLKSLGDVIVRSLAQHTGALVGAMYLVDGQGVFELAGQYGCVSEEGLSDGFKVGEGLLGQAAKDRETLRIASVPADYMRVSSGLGAAPPQSLLMVPIERGDGVAGVVELGGYREFTDQQAKFVELSGERIAVAIDSLRYKLRLQTALHETRRQASELEEKQRELAQANETLEEWTQRLETSNRDLEAFAYVASHDLQEPLRKIEVYAQRFEQKCGDGLNPQGREYLGRMRGASQRIRALINDLLSFSRVTTRAEPFQPADLGAVIEQATGDLEVSIEHSGAEVEVGPMPTVQGDPAQLGQLFQNLISNALKFRRKGVKPSIRIWARPVDGELAEANGSPAPGRCEISVEDNGIGIEEKFYDKIFQVFQRLHGRSKYEGTGIGLALCRKIARRHGGEISVASVPGRGSRFSIILTVSEPEEGRHVSAA